MPELGIMPFSTLTRQQRGVFPLPHPRSKEGRLQCPYIFRWWGEPHQNFLLYTVHKIILNLHVKTLLVTAGADATVQILFIYILTRNRPYSMLLHLLLPRYIGPVLCGNSLARYRGKNYAKPSSESVWSRSWLSANQKTEHRLGRKKYVDV